MFPVYHPSQVGLELDRYVFVNSARDFTCMSTQQTGNTCYFQTYLFAVLCKVGLLSLGDARDGHGILVEKVEELQGACGALCRHLLEFFVAPPEGEEGAAATQAEGRGGTAEGAAGAAGAGVAGMSLEGAEGAEGGAPPLSPPPVMRPLTNCNVVLDFHRYEDAAYYTLATPTPTPTPNPNPYPYPYTRYEDAAYYTLALRYLRSLTKGDTKGDTYSVVLPVYEEQLRQLLCYYRGTRVLHGYGRFRLEGPVSSTPNTKSLQPVLGAEDGVYKLARLGYYKYRAANLMFGFNTHVTSRLAPTPNP